MQRFQHRNKCVAAQHVGPALGVADQALNAWAWDNYLDRWLPGLFLDLHILLLSLLLVHS